MDGRSPCHAVSLYHACRGPLAQLLSHFTELQQAAEAHALRQCAAASSKSKAKPKAAVSPTNPLPTSPNPSAAQPHCSGKARSSEHGTCSENDLPSVLGFGCCKSTELASAYQAMLPSGQLLNMLFAGVAGPSAADAGQAPYGDAAPDVSSAAASGGSFVPRVSLRIRTALVDLGSADRCLVLLSGSLGQVLSPGDAALLCHHLHPSQVRLSIRGKPDTLPGRCTYA